jgi:hypothetical protein
MSRQIQLLEEKTSLIQASIAEVLHFIDGHDRTPRLGILQDFRRHLENTKLSFFKAVKFPFEAHELPEISELKQAQAQARTLALQISDNLSKMRDAIAAMVTHDGSDRAGYDTHRDNGLQALNNLYYQHAVLEAYHQFAIDHGALQSEDLTKGDAMVIDKLAILENKIDALESMIRGAILAPGDDLVEKIVRPKSKSVETDG